MDDDTRGHLLVVSLIMVSVGLLCALMALTSGCQDSSTRVSAARPGRQPVLCAMEPGGTPARYEVRRPWPEARASHGVYCPAAVSDSQDDLCMWQGYDEMRHQYVSVYGPSCTEAP